MIYEKTIKHTRFKVLLINSCGNVLVWIRVQDSLTKRQNRCDEVSEINLLLEIEGFKMLEKKNCMNKHICYLT
jgi:hypothetical protein